jgi:hypothetical protein
MTRTAIVLECLESRTLFAGVPSPTIQADLNQIALDQHQMAIDAAAGRPALVADHRQLALDIAAARRGDPALVAQLRSDQVGFAEKIHADNASLAASLAADRAAIAGDGVQIRLDRGNVDALAADRLKLSTDVAKLHSDAAAGTVAIVNDHTAQHAAVGHDLELLLASRASASPTLAADRAKLATDSASLTQTLLSDREKLVEDRLKLVNDLRAGA